MASSSSRSSCCGDPVRPVPLDAGAEETSGRFSSAGGLICERPHLALDRQHRPAGGLLAVDVLIIGRRPHEPSMRECAIAITFFVGLAIMFGAGVWSFAGRQYGGRVLRRLADGVQPVHRQPVRLRHHHGEVRGAAADTSRPRCSSASSWRWSCAASSSRSAPRPSRTSAGSSTSSARSSSTPRQAGHPGRDGRGRLRGEPAARSGSSTVPRHPGVARRQAVRADRRQAGHHPDVHRDPRARHHGPAVRAGLDPGDLRPHLGARTSSSPPTSSP